MKITIQLDDAQVAGLKDYIRETGNADKPTKQDIKIEIQSIVDGYLQSQHSALTDCINKYR